MMQDKKPVKIALITGYLGAGKTTLLNHILSNDEGIRAAVIVNDIGEVNVDADLIEKGGVVTQENSNLVPLTNGCICCTLRDDLANQLRELAVTGRYDYIIIEASGICEPIPIAQTIADICEESTEDGLPMMLDNIIAVVDCARMHDEFEDGRSLLKDSYEEEDIENLLIQQLEFCNTVLLNKVDTVDEYQLGELKAIVKSLQTSAVIIEGNYAKVSISDVLNTGRFDLEKSMSSAGWIEAIQNADIEDADDEHEHHHHDDDDDDEHEHHHDDDDDDEHEHHHDDDDDDDDEHEHHHDDDDEKEEHGHHGHGHHHHHHHHKNADVSYQVEEYGIGSFVYFRRRPFDRDKLVGLAEKWPRSIIRCKGMVWYKQDPSMSYIFEQAGRLIQEMQSGRFLASADQASIDRVLAKYPEVRKMWDPRYGDRMQKLVFIGQNMDREEIERELDECLVD
ncbi:MAG: GTP-binding protein [Lachnospiraceae bacterium]|nr:GTP-binding protein [Lachnospiraceae bacterium]